MSRRRVALPWIVPVLVALATAMPAAATTSPHQRWEQLWNGGGNDSGAVVRVSPAGDRIYVTGRSDGKPSPQTDLVTIAYTTAGKRLWVDRYAADWSAQPQDMVVSADGTRIYVAANAYRTANSLGNDYLTIAYSASGTRLWTARYDDPQHKDDQVYDLAVRPDGSAVYVTGSSFGMRSRSCGGGSEYDAEDIATVAYTKGGAQKWVARYDNEVHSNDVGIGVAVDPSTGDVIVAGVSRLCISEVTLLAYHPDGSSAWTHVDDASQSFGEYPTGLGVDGDTGTIFVGGGRFVSADDSVFLVAAYSLATGEPLWRKGYAGPGKSTYPWGFVLGQGDRLYVGGSTGPPFGNARWDFAAFDGASGGGLLWNATYAHGAGLNVAYRMAGSGDGTRLYGFGTVGTGPNRVASFSTDDGTLQWSAPTVSSDWLGVSPLGGAPRGDRVYYTGIVGVHRGPFQDDTDFDVRAFAGG